MQLSIIDEQRNLTGFSDESGGDDRPSTRRTFDSELSSLDHTGQDGYRHQGMQHVNVTPGSNNKIARKTRKDIGWDKTIVKAFVKASLFPRMKWINEEAGDLDFSLEKNTVCYACLQFQGMLEKPRREMEVCWRISRNVVQEELDCRRNGIQSLFKKEFSGELICNLSVLRVVLEDSALSMWFVLSPCTKDMHNRMKEADTQMPQLKDYLLRHQSSFYNTFFDVFVKRVVGVRKFERHATKHLLSEFVTVTDEAFALLVYENQEERWRIMAEENHKKLTKEAKCTDGGGGKDLPMSGKTRRGRGWSSSGMARFNQLCNDIQRERTSDSARHKFEKSYKRLKKEELAKKKKKASRKKNFDDDEGRPAKVFNEMDQVPFHSTASAFIDAGGDASDSDDELLDNEDQGCVGTGSEGQRGPSGSFSSFQDCNGHISYDEQGRAVDDDGNVIQATVI